MFTKKSKIYIAGHAGMVGSACIRVLNKNGYSNIITKTFAQLDLRNQEDVDNFIKSENPDIIVDAAAKVGGILANDKMPYDFLMDNMLIQNNLIRAAHKCNIKKFIFLGSSCIYPKFAPQPLKEEYLLTDSLEPTNQWYAIAKISGVKLIEALRLQFNRDYVSLMPTNLYGPKDNFDLKTSHVLPAMIRKFHDAKINNLDSVVLWGSGNPYREFLHVDDLAQAVILAIQNNLDEYLYNVGYGDDITIRNLAKIIKSCVGYKGNIFWDESKPDGTPKKLMDSSKFKNIGWKPTISLEKGVESVYSWYLKNI
tara:strand:- start:2966 stop:3895 length:930 start_codon:yes stop_codon:yes gene_type:complete